MEKKLETTVEEVKQVPQYREVEFPRYQGGPTDAQVVALNDNIYQIVRGRKVMVPIAVAEIVENGQAQERKALTMLDEIVRKSEERKI